MKMIIRYRDELGGVIVEVDGNGISFWGGKAYFSDGKSDYQIPVEHIVYIL